MLNVWMIRHSITAGNQKKRYIGVTDEPLCEQGIELLQEKSYPPVDALFVSPLMRCRQTAAALYPGKEQQVLANFRECDFGEFENKNYLELADHPKYQEWVDSNATLPFPGGESREGFQKRSVAGFEQMLGMAREQKAKDVAIVVHGGTIMSLMDEFAGQEKKYYEWYSENACGYQVCVDLQPWEAGEKRFYHILKCE